jgi:50S ribosomal subunit-associated GTPase HflX
MGRNDEKGILLMKERRSLTDSFKSNLVEIYEKQLFFHVMKMSENILGSRQVKCLADKI